LVNRACDSIRGQVRTRIGRAAIGGRLKERAEDFLVEEIPLYVPCGEGEHLYLGVQKTNMPHSEMLSLLCRHFDVGRVGDRIRRREG
jgi:tRNA(Glu) U13 pseudouridine synthase TruD